MIEKNKTLSKYGGLTIHFPYSKSFNVSLRLLTLIVKFLFVFFFAKLADPIQISFYGLFVAAIGYVTYIVGLDYYTYSTRLLVSQTSTEQGGTLKGQIYVTIVMYFIILPIALALMASYNIPKFMLWCFAPILILEHINQEIFRILVAFSKQVSASFLNFIRQGLWIVCFIPTIYYFPSLDKLKTLMLFWALSSFVAALYGLWLIYKRNIKGWNRGINWQSVQQGLRVSFLFFIATLALRAMQSLDRYWVEHLNGIDAVAPYVVFIGVAGAFIAFLDAGVFSYMYPSLIKLYNDARPEDGKKLLRKSTFQVVLCSIFFATISLYIVPYLVGWLNNDIYWQYMFLYKWLLSASVMFALSMLPHYGLYALKYDFWIVLSHIVGFLFFVISIFIVKIFDQTMAVPFALNTAFFAIFFIKTLAFIYVDKAVKK